MDKINFITYTLIIIFLCNVLAFIISMISVHFDFFQKFRIQKRRVKPAVFYKRLPLILTNIILLSITTTIGLFFIFPIFDPSLNVDLVKIIIQFVVIVVVDDLYFYMFHSWMHSNKYFFKKIHITHHKTIAPIAMDYLYVHPLEWFIGYFGPFLAIFLISLFNPVCIASFWSYQIIRNIHEIDVHSGFKSFISSWLPFWGEAEHHDLHHERFDGNYASTFTFWDHIFKTKIVSNEKK